MLITYSNVVSWQTYFNTTYVFNETTGQVYPLKDTAQSFWLTLQKTADFSTVIALLSHQYPGVSRIQLETDMSLFAKKLQEKGLIDIFTEGE